MDEEELCFDHRLIEFNRRHLVGCDFERSGAGAVERQDTLTTDETTGEGHVIRRGCAEFERNRKWRWLWSAVGDEEPAVTFEPRMKCKAQQTALVKASRTKGAQRYELRCNIQERCRKPTASSIYNPYLTWLICNKQPAGSIMRRRDEVGRREAIAYKLDCDRLGCVGRLATSQSQGECSDHRYLSLL